MELRENTLNRLKEIIAENQLENHEHVLELAFFMKGENVVSIKRQDVISICSIIKPVEHKKWEFMIKLEDGTIIRCDYAWNFERFMVINVIVPKDMDIYEFQNLNQLKRVF
ncbi:gp124 [Sphingomonas phage PAU]|uniref:gp124 n=1 Tax=Sphingomonas phage PAU TaxID=1150991 RepID=UPI000257326F|nr:gp124 [Sphingomonas phage PAU]AFF28122.1 gp124 [Sphingomonas phage PAU]